MGGNGAEGDCAFTEKLKHKMLTCHRRAESRKKTNKSLFPKNQVLTESMFDSGQRGLTSNP